MSQLPNSNQNPFGKEDWLAQVIQLDPQAQKSQKLAFQKFNAKILFSLEVILKLVKAVKVCKLKFCLTLKVKLMFGVI